MHLAQKALLNQHKRRRDRVFFKRFAARTNK